MKGSKVSASFVTKFSSYLAKFKETSTINIAHDQIRKLFSEYKYSDIVLAFVGKIDSCDQLTQKQKKEHSKVYITLIDVYGQDVVLQHYQRLIESIVKKPVGISEVVGHLCKTLLNRIYPVENIENYIKHLLVMFKSHTEIPKIIKQIMESFDSSLTDQFQSEMLTIIVERINMQKSKVEYLDAILSVILSLEDKFNSEMLVQSIILRNLKNDDWNTRKICVDISYSLLVIREEANEALHHLIKDMRYDKIKHVREAVANYYVLYKQIYGDEKHQQPVSDKKTPSKIGVSKSPNFRKTVGPSSIPSNNARSLEKSAKKSRNQHFFEHAKNKDVIKTPEERSLIMPKQKVPVSQPNSKSWNKDPLINEYSSKQKIEEKSPEKDINFQSYLKNRPKSEYFQFMPNEKLLQNEESSQENNIPKIIEREDNTFRKRQQESDIKFQSPLADSSLSLIQETNQSLRSQILCLKEMFSSFQSKILNKIDGIQTRVLELEKKYSGEETMRSRMSSSSVEQAFDHRFQKTHKSSEVSESLSLPSESNLEDKVKQSILKNNWDEAFALVLANNKRTLLLQLLTHCRIPSDKLVVDCLFMEVKKELKNWISLKWLLTLLQETEVSHDKLKKLKKELQKINNNLSQDSESRNYFMLKNMLMNEVDEQLKQY